MSSASLNFTTIPTNPGVYLYKDIRGDIIYVGKAKNLRNRVRSYFNKSGRSAKTALLVKNISDLDYIIVDNEVEALLLENKLIKKHQPRFNIALKDGKTYAYLKLTDEKFPRLVTTRKVTNKGTYFGPFVGGGMRQELSQLAQRLFKLRSCRNLPKRECLNYHIGLCTAPCILAANKEEYGKQVAGAKRFLKGHTDDIIDMLTTEMKEASDKMHYEIALEKKRQIDSVVQIHQKQKVDTVKRYDQHVVACKVSGPKAYFTLFSVSKGVISGKKEYEFDAEEDIFESFIKLYYSQHTIPNEIIVNDAFWNNSDEKEALEGYLTRQRGGKVVLTHPVRGEKKALAYLAVKNIGLTNSLLVELQEKLILPEYPQVIECFDISNLGDEHIVGGMTQWVNGKPNKSGYRKFEVKGQDAQDDFKAMKECVYRRYHRLLHEGKSFPNLIIIDGGLGQLHAALSALEDVGAQIPIVSLAKKDELLYVPGRDDPYDFDTNGQMMLLVRQIRDSVHRFVLAYNRKKRQMKLRKNLEK